MLTCAVQATGTAEPGGWTSRELLTILDGLSGLAVVGGDVVEVAPIYDNPGETTVLAAAQVAQSLIALMVDKPVKSIADRASEDAPSDL
jgi:agmatinase